MQSHKQFVTRRQIIKLPCSMLIVASVGCMAPWLQKPDPNSPEARKSKRDAIKEVLESDDRPRLISEIATSPSISIGRIENLGLVTQLPGTGGVVSASDQREKMLNIMRRHDVDQPNKLLDDPNTAMVVVFVNVPPGARKGTIHNAGIRKSTHAEATSLRSGWLMRTDLAEVRMLDGRTREGFDFAAAEGPIVTEAQVTGKTDPEAQFTGTIVGGARLFKDRPLGIAFVEEFADAVTQAAVLPAINERFTVFDGQKKDGIATPKKDNYIDLAVPKRYEKDPYHFVNVVLSLSFAESPSRRAERIELCKKQLLEPTTVRTAAWQLEAIGKEAIPIFNEVLSHPDPEVRFYAAHALAYLNEPQATAVLKQLAPEQSAFRAMCLTALATLDHYQAEDALLELLHASDPETRFGAIQAIRTRDPNNPVVSGIPIGKTGSILQIPSNAPPLVAISLEQRPEVVIFGKAPVLKLPSVMHATSRIMLKTEPNGMVTVSHFAPNTEDRVTQCAADLPSVLTALSDVGATYGDWVSFTRECSEKGVLTEPLAMNPLPTAGRAYDRVNKRSIEAQLEPGEAMPATTYQAEKKTDDAKATVAWYNPFTWWN